MQNTIEKGMKIHPVGTLLAVLACMVIFYVCNFIMTKFSKARDELLNLEIKQHVEEVRLGGQGTIESESVERERVEDLKTTEADVERTRKDKARPRTIGEIKQLPVPIKT